MSLFALIKNNVVVNVILADQGFIDANNDGELFDTSISFTDDEARPGPKWTYDGSDFSPPPAPTENKIIIKNDNTGEETSIILLGDVVIADVLDAITLLIDPDAEENANAIAEGNEVEVIK